MVFASILRGLGGILSVAAGVYLLLHNGQTITIAGQVEQSWLEVIAHGLGIGLIGMGLFMFGSMWASMYEDDEKAPR